MPVWGVWFDETLYWSSSPDSQKAKNLARDPSIVVHLESGDDVVVIEGRVEQTTLDAAVADAYTEKYDFRPDPGDPDFKWFALRPRVAYAWLERDYPGTATRYEWD
jgi:hypothetical protein